MKIVLYIVLGLLALCLLLLLAAVIRTLLTPARRSEWTPRRDPEREAAYAEKLARMVRCETVSAKGEIRREKFLAFHGVLAELFPLVHEKLEKTEIDGALLYRWPGASAERPLVLMAHQDVVPAEGEWTHGHFSGDIDEEGRIWGRGSADDKSSLMTISRPSRNCWRTASFRRRTCTSVRPTPKKWAATDARRSWRSWKSGASDPIWSTTRAAP